jgi:hypothetical protein
MEHNLAGYAKYYSCGCRKIFKRVNSEGKLIIVKEIFMDIGNQMLKTSYILSLRELLKITHELMKYLWQKLK